MVSFTLLIVLLCLLNAYSFHFSTRIVRLSEKRMIKAGFHNNRMLRFQKMSSFDSVYREHKVDSIAQIVDNPVLKVFTGLLNPATMMIAIYLSSFGWASLFKIRWIQRLFGRFRGDKGNTTNVKSSTSNTGKNNSNGDDDDDDTPLQTYECDVCKLQMRPARGRAEVILGRPRFRCSRCGSSAKTFFDIDDMSDLRAVKRQKAIEAEKEEEESSGYYDKDDDDDDDDDYDEDNRGGYSLDR